MQSQAINKTEGRVHKPDLAKEKKNQLTVTLYIGGSQVDTLTAEQSERMAKRLGEVMSTYYTSHPAEYERMTK